MAECTTLYAGVINDYYGSEWELLCCYTQPSQTYDDFLTGLTETYDNYCLKDRVFADYVTQLYNNCLSGVSSAMTGVYVTGGTANGTDDNLIFTNSSGGTFTVANSALLFNDAYVSGGTLNTVTGCVTFGNTSGGTFEVCGFSGFTSYWSANTDGSISTSGVTEVKISADTMVEGDVALETLSPIGGSISINSIVYQNDHFTVINGANFRANGDVWLGNQAADVTTVSGDIGISGDTNINGIISGNTNARFGGILGVSGNTFLGGVGAATPTSTDKILIVQSGGLVESITTAQLTGFTADYWVGNGSGTGIKPSGTTTNVDVTGSLGVSGTTYSPNLSSSTVTIQTELNTPVVNNAANDPIITLGSTPGIDVTGNISTNENLNVTGNTFINGTLSAMGNTTLNGVTGISGRTYLGTIDAAGASYSNDKILVAQSNGEVEYLTTAELKQDIADADYWTANTDGSISTSGVTDVKISGDTFNKGNLGVSGRTFLGTIDAATPTATDKILIVQSDGEIESITTAELTGFTSDYWTGDGTGTGIKPSGVTTNVTVDGNIHGNSNLRIDQLVHFNTASTSANTYIGYQAGNPGVNGTLQQYNTAIGHQALASQIGGQDVDENTALGYRSLYRLTTGEWNTAVGANTGRYVTTGDGNTVIGKSAFGGPNAIGTYNIAIGYMAAYNIKGSGNMFFGIGTGAGNNSGTATGGNNVGIGDYSLGGGGVTAGVGTLTTGDYNLGIGSKSLKNITSGDYNVAIGGLASDNITSGDYNITIGYQQDPSSATADYQMNIGGIIYGKDLTSSSSINAVGIGIVSPTAKLHVDGTTILTGELGVSGDTNINGVLSGLTDARFGNNLGVSGRTFLGTVDTATPTAADNILIVQSTGEIESITTAQLTGFTSDYWVGDGTGTGIKTSGYTTTTVKIKKLDVDNGAIEYDSSSAVVKFGQDNSVVFNQDNGDVEFTVLGGGGGTTTNKVLHLQLVDGGHGATFFTNNGNTSNQTLVVNGIISGNTNARFNGNLGVSGDTYFGSSGGFVKYLDNSGGPQWKTEATDIYHNTGGDDVAFHFKGGGDANLFWVEGAGNKVGVGHLPTAASSKLSVGGSFSALGHTTLSSILGVSGRTFLGTIDAATPTASDKVLIIQSTGEIESITTTQLTGLTDGLFWTANTDGSISNSGLTGHVGVGTDTPNKPLTVVGDISGTTAIYLGNPTIFISGETNPSTGDLSIHSGDDIELYAGDDIVLNATEKIKFTQLNAAQPSLQIDLNDNAGTAFLQNAGNDTVIAIDDANQRLYFYDIGGEYIVSDGSDLTIAAGDDIKLVAVDKVILDTGGDVEFKDSGTLALTIDVGTATGDAIFEDAGGTEIFRIDGSEDSLLMATNIKIQFADTGEYIVSDGTDLTIASGVDIILNPTAHAGIGISTPTTKLHIVDTGEGEDPLRVQTVQAGNGYMLLIQDDGVVKKSEKVIVTSTGDVGISGNTNINGILSADTNVIVHGVLGVSGATNVHGELSAATNVHVKGVMGISGRTNMSDSLLMATDKKVEFSTTDEHIVSDGTDLTIASGAKINLTATSDVVVPANVGITFGTGEKIEGDNTDLTITSGAKINLAATSDVYIPKNVGLVFDDNSSEKIESDDTDLTISSGAKINLTATSDIHVPVNVGVVFGTGEKIEGDNTDLTITSGADIILASTANVGIGITTPKTKLDVHHDPTGLATHTGGGEVVTFGSGTLVTGKLHYMNTSGAWILTNANTVGLGSSELIGIALGTSVSAGVLLRGFFDMTSFLGPGSFNQGVPLYVSGTVGSIAVTQPAGSTDFVRVVGYCTNTANVIYFNPDGTYIKIA
jgi:hypothetical protein|tara:strand:+ start:70 stop:5565 length:5496 start_codon:yes stop_codon:yes gene_type:complete